MQKITTFLTFNNQAEEAVNLYVAAFKNSEILNVSRYGEGAPALAGTRGRDCHHTRALLTRPGRGEQHMEWVSLALGAAFALTAALALALALRRESPPSR